MRLALVRIRDADVATHWSNASVAGVPSDPLPTDPDWAQGTLYVDERLVGRRVAMGSGSHGYSAFLQTDDLVAAYHATVADIAG